MDLCLYPLYLLYSLDWLRKQTLSYYIGHYIEVMAPTLYIHTGC